MAVTEASRRRLGAVLLVVLGLGGIGAALAIGPLAQDPAYHGFADRRALLGIPNFSDVVSNLAFALVGLLGLAAVARTAPGGSARAWRLLFIGVLLVSAGSGWYHLAPDSQRLVWDRLPMALGFGGLIAALLGEHEPRLAGPWLLPVCAGVSVASVLWWAWSGDLRPYVLVQLASVACVPAVIALYPPRHTHRWLLLAAVGCYVLAKITEHFDHPVFGLSGQIVSGHTLKHLFAAAAIGCIALMIARRRALPAPAPRGATPAMSAPGA